MRFWQFAVVFCLCVVNGKGFINPYPRYDHYHDGGDPGEPLFLTPYIENGKIDEGQKMARVSLPGMPDLESYAGYLTVDKDYNSNMFFWYFPAEIKPKEAPLVLWLQGGPGASSMFGLFTENGPVFIQKNLKLKRRKYSWHLNHNLLYFDNPVGTGFSFTDNEAGYAKDEVDVGENLYRALVQFLQLFPQLQKVDFFATGESYGGKYVPAIAYTIHSKNLMGTSKVKVNLRGVAIGNGLSDPYNQLKYGDYLYQLGLIDHVGRDEFHKFEDQGRSCIKKRDFDCAFRVFDDLLNMDETNYDSLFKNMSGYDTYFNYLHPKGSPDEDARLGKYLQQSDTRRAIHVGNNSFHDVGQNKVEEHLRLDVMDSVAPWISELLSYYKVVIYNGQLDIIVAYPLTLNYLQNLNFDGADLYKNAPRYIWKVDDDIAGYVKEVKNIVEIMIRNAGHMAPHDQPKWVLDMLLHLTQGKEFSKSLH